MTSRRIVICITDGSTGRDPERGVEGLRAAVGLVRATEEHEVEIVLQGAASAWLTAGQSPETASMLAQLRAAEVPWYVSGADDVVEGAEVLDDEGLGKLLAEAEIVLRY